MEINKFDKEITGVVVDADIVEGRFGILKPAIHSADYGSQTDLPGFDVPATAEEAKRARHVIVWAQDNREFPAFRPIPSLSWSLRQGGWDQAQTHPFTATIYLTNPQQKEGLTIPSGTPSLAFGKGVYTFPSGAFIDSASWAAGTLVIVANTAEDTTDAGKPKYQATFDDRVVGVVREYNATTHKLTVEVNY